MKITKKIDSNSYLVEWKYKDFLRVGHEFQGATIIKLEQYDYLKSEYVKVTVKETRYSI